MRRLDGKIALVTGANSGIGLETSVELARLGAHVVMVARDRARGEAARAQVATRSHSRELSLSICDLSSQAAIRALAAEVTRRHPKLHIVVNNAGSVFPRRSLTVDGVERTFAVNHLGAFLLTTLLLDAIKAGARSRIINVSSLNHAEGDMDFGDLQYEQGYFVRKAYARSKLANILFTSELARRLEGTGVTANCLHPGVIATNIYAHAPWYLKPLLTVGKLLMEKPEAGARRIVYLATSSELDRVSGAYFDKNQRVDPSPIARDRGVAERLWQESTRLVRAA